MSYKAKEKYLYDTVRTHSGSTTIFLQAEWWLIWLTWQGAQGAACCSPPGHVRPGSLPFPPPATTAPQKGLTWRGQTLGSLVRDQTQLNTYAHMCACMHMSKCRLVVRSNVYNQNSELVVRFSYAPALGMWGKLRPREKALAQLRSHPASRSQEGAQSPASL